MYAHYEGSASGLVGTVAVTILNADGSSYAARTTAGITEPIAGSGVYAVADPDPTLTLTFIWDEGAGGLGTSETLYAGRGSTASDVADAVRTDLTPELAHLDADVSDAVAAPGLALAAYDPPTRAEATADKEAVLEAIAALPDDADVESVLEAVAAVKVKTDQIGAADVTVTSPVASSGSVRLHAGDDYDAAHGRALEFAVADATHALGLDAATILFKATQVTWEATGASETEGGYLVTFEPTAAQTSALTLLSQPYELEAELSDGDVVTLATGTLAVERDIPAV